ncbi:O-antigen polymerase [uncultured Polaribacter sp.]|uniref:O-antigen polymerase n=1 Tax=uncultured Polaribacter sp. TaxID=174711 RepID=UPI00261FAF7C|nr:O-antigen polymerase [uncultured Polaribacter sp.]
MIKSKTNIDYLLLLSILIVLVFPLFPPIFGNNSFHIIPISLILSGVIFLKNYKYFSISKDFIKVCVFFFITFLLLLLSLINDIFNLPETGFSDFLGIVKPVYFLIFFLVGHIALNNSFNTIKTLCLFFDIVIILSFILAISEVFFIDHFKRILYILFKREEKLVILDKATGWFGVTYYFAYFSLLTFYYILFKLSKSKNIKDWFLLIFAFFTVILTQSRTVIISLLIGLMILPFLKISRKNSFIKLFYIFLFSIIFILLFYYSEIIKENFKYAYVGILRTIENGTEIGNQGSLAIRFDQIIWSWNTNFYKIIGFGLGRGVPLESIYAQYIYRYGIVYLIIYLFLFLYFFIISTRLAIKLQENLKDYAFFSGFGVFYLTSPISLFASSSHEMPKIAFCFFICSAVVFKMYHKNFK